MSAAGQGQPHEIGAVEDIPPGQHKLVLVGGREVGVYNVGGRFYALRNLCPHQGAPLCRGTVDGTTLASQPGEYVWGRQGEILRCPWHAWEFDLTTGQCLAQPRVRAKTYRVEAAGGKLLLWL